MSKRKLLFSFLFLFLVLASFVLTSEKPPRWPMFEKHQIDLGANEAATVADINKDGRLDIVSGENWYEAPEWHKHRMREIPFQSGYLDDFSNFPMDVNGDGYPDIIGCSWFSKKLSWHENPRRFDGELANTLWKEHVIESGFNYELMLLVDIDGDGKVQEILPNYGSTNEIAWWELAGAGTQRGWTRHTVGMVSDVKGLHGVGAGDLNGDGRPDILTPRGWFEGPPNPRSETWNFHPDFQLMAPKSACGPILVQDVNGDGKNDLVYTSAHDYGVYWSENRGGKFEEHFIDDSWSQAHAMTLIDIDRDGRLDIVTGKRYLAHDIDPGAYEPLGLYWYRLGKNGQFTKQVLDYGTKTGAGMQIPVIDIDGDGDLDIVAPGKSGLFLFEQVDFPRQKSL